MHFTEPKTYFVYIMSNRSKTLYTGVTNSFSFTALTLTATVPPQYTGNGTENYLPHLECSLQLYYSTTDAEDPGSFVSMVPTGPLPIIRMTGASPERGVDLVAYGRPGRTHIVECSTNTASCGPSIGCSSLCNGDAQCATGMKCNPFDAGVGLSLSRCE